MSSLAAHASLAPFADATSDPAALGFSADRLARISGWMRGYVEAGKLPYAMTAILRDGQLAYLDACGSVDPDNGGEAPAVDHIARIYSMTKLITTVAAMTLFEEGRLQLDEPIARHLPEFAEPTVATEDGIVPANRGITVRDLMTHSSGLTYGQFDPGPVGAAYRKAEINFSDRTKSLAEMVTRVAGLPLGFHPGSKWTYSVATDVLGRLVEVVAGAPLDQVLRDRVLGPLGMADTSFGPAPGAAGRLAACYEKTATGGMKRIDGRADSRYASPAVMHSGGGGLTGTLPDYLRFLEMFRRGGEFGGARILGRKTVELMAMNHLPGDIASMGVSTFSEMPMVGIGFGLGGSVLLDPARAQILGSPGEFAWGGVASTGFWVDRKEGITVVYFTQLMPSSSWPIRRELRVLTYQALVD